MSDIIRLLPDAVANQIAAGEVVQRPASVVKELVENSLDSGATRITINIKDAGKTLIQISDNGCGMSATDARMAFERHATSKIREANDLFNIRTMGFRGEALASIAAVAWVELKSKLHDADLGTYLSIKGSNVEKQEPVHCDSGSNFQVKNLFYNIPARRKFLKKDSTEFKHILDEIHRVAIVNKDVSFRLIHNGQELYYLPISNTKERIQHLFGRSMAKELVPVFSDSSLVKVEGFIGKPEFAKKKTGYQYFFVNGRFMKHPYFFKTILNTYKDVLSSNLLPSFFICLELDPAQIDINIHPTKTEIKFEEEFAIARLIGATVKEAIGKFNFVPSMNFDEEISLTTKPMDKDEVPLPSIHINQEYNPFSEKNSISSLRRAESYDKLQQKENVSDWLSLMQETQNTETKQLSIDIASQSEDTFSEDILQWNNKYIVSTTENGLMIINQRRAHHRVLYEQYLKTMQEQKGVAQQLAFPIEKEISEDEALMIQEVQEELFQLGFDFSISNKTLLLTAFPENMKESQAMASFDGIVADFQQFNANILFERQKYIAKILSYKAIVDYKPLAKKEMQILVQNLFQTTEPSYCPNGKKIFTLLNEKEIEYKLKL